MIDLIMKSAPFKTRDYQTTNPNAVFKTWTNSMEMIICYSASLKQEGYRKKPVLSAW